jgi:hypothetical protein
MILGEGSSLLFGNWKERKCIGIYRRNWLCYRVLNIIYLFEQTCFQKIDENGLENTKLSDIDVIVMHAPGTIKGDLTEYKAFRNSL